MALQTANGMPYIDKQGLQLSENRGGIDEPNNSVFNKENR